MATALLVSQVTLSALSPRRAPSNVSDNTATPNGSGITLMTPLTFITSGTLTFLGLAPSIGVCSTEA